MTDPERASLASRTRALLEPGDIALSGAIVHTDYDRSEEVRMMDATLEVGDVIARHAGVEADAWYVHSGTDDPEFASNQHQGLTLADDAFVWECQHLLRDGTFDIVIYYRATADQGAVLAEIRDLGYDVTGVETE